MTRRRGGFRLRIGLVALALLILVALALPFIVPLDGLAPRIEAPAAQALGLPVRIGGVRLHLLPLPHAGLRDIEIGKGEIRIASVSAWPDWSLLIRGTPALSRVSVDDVELRDSALPRLTAAGKPGGGTAGPLPALIEVKRLRPILRGKAAGEWNARILLDPAGRPDSIRLRNGGLEITLDPAQRGRWPVSVSARDWKLPVGPAFTVAELSARGTLDAKSFDLPAIRGVIHGGRLGGKLRLLHAGPARLEGGLQIEGLDLATLAREAGAKQGVSGRFSADSILSGQAVSLAALGVAARIEGRFNVAGGAVQGIDLASAARNVLLGGQSGGETRFDELRGRFQAQAAGIRLRELHASSGVIEAKGNVDIGAGGALSGTVDVDLRSTRGFVGIPLALTGTVNDPGVRPTRGSAIGAAVGTVVLPGVGTSLGASVGRFFERRTEK